MSLGPCCKAAERHPPTSSTVTKDQRESATHGWSSSTKPSRPSPVSRSPLAGRSSGPTRTRSSDRARALHSGARGPQHRTGTLAPADAEVRLFTSPTPFSTTQPSFRGASVAACPLALPPLRVPRQIPSPFCRSATASSSRCRSSPSTSAGRAACAWSRICSAASAPSSASSASGAPSVDEPTFKDLYEVGTLARVVKVIRLGPEQLQRGAATASAASASPRRSALEPYMRAQHRAHQRSVESRRRARRARARRLRESTREVLGLMPNLPQGDRRHPRQRARARRSRRSHRLELPAGARRRSPTSSRSSRPST